MEPAETVSRDTLTALNKGDLLFVDSTHTVKPGSEVNRLVLDILPRLEAWACSFISTTSTFPTTTSGDCCRMNCSSAPKAHVLHAFLIDNAHCRIVLSLSMLHYAVPDRMKFFYPALPAAGKCRWACWPGRHPFSKRNLSFDTDDA